MGVTHDDQSQLGLSPQQLFGPFALPRRGLGQLVGAGIMVAQPRTQQVDQPKADLRM
jgi:hypothetical protein